MITNPLVVVIACVLCVVSAVGLRSLTGTPKNGTLAFHALCFYVACMLSASVLVAYYNIDYFKAIF